MGLISLIAIVVMIGLVVWMVRQQPVPVDRAAIPLQMWDVVFGAVLIGGGPMVCLFLPSFLLPSRTSGWISGVVAGVSIVLTLAVWTWTVRHRFRRRVSTRWFLVVEVVIGAVVAFAYFCAMGMAAYTASGG